MRAFARRLKLGGDDMGQAARDAALLAELCRTDGRAQSDGETALITGVVLAYARPFTRCDDVGGLDADESAPTDVRQASLHRMLIASRNHRLTDTTDRSGDSGDASGFPAGVSARQWGRIGELAAEQERRMRAYANRLEAELRRNGDGADGPGEEEPPSIGFSTAAA